ncbi:MAG: hypothetical protein K6F34_03525 [Lachnospiraceae bacterium]|nr:hypothetical protein [Lachnospiraceae bacterium]
MSTVDNDKKQKGIWKALTAILLAAIVVAGGLYLWSKQSAQDKDTKQEAEADETAEVTVEEAVSVVEEEEVKVSMIGRVRELEALYMDEKMDYEEVMEELEPLKDEVYDDAAEYEEVIAKIERVDKSRSSYNMAVREFEKGRYAEAVKDYKEVISEDERYYEKAGDGIEECNEAVRQLVKGTWSYEYDARKEVEQYVRAKGFEVDLSKIKIPIVFLFKLDDKGSIDVTIDYDALDEYIDKVLDLAADALSNGLEAEGLSNPAISSMLKQLYGSTGLKDKVRSELNIRQELDSLMTEAGLDKFDSYNVEDGHLYIGTACIDVSLTGDVLTLTSEGSKALGVGNYSMPYPIKMVRYAEDKDTVSGNKKGE